MRNGIYRVWYKNTEHGGSAIVIMADGRLIACDRTHKFLGSYCEHAGQLTATIEIVRHNLVRPRPEFPNLDTFHMDVCAITTGEAIKGIGTFPEQPGAALDLEFVWYSEV